MTERVGLFVKCSSLFETAPVGFSSDHLFLNAVALFQTQLSPEQLLTETQAIEKRMGRSEKSHDGQHFDRIIDIDLLMLGNLVVETPELSLPHKHMTSRRFVMEPFAEIAPDCVHPVFGKTMRQLLQKLEEDKTVN